MNALRNETHYGSRVVRCFAERPAHIDAMFREVAARNPDRDALVLGEERISYRTLDAAAEAVAGNLTKRGFRKGDRIALLLGNCFAFVCAVLACARAGIIVVPMSIRQRAPETEFILTQCEAAGLIYQGDLAAHLPDRSTLPHLRDVFVVGDGPGTPFAELTTRAAAPAVAIGEEDIFSLLYTSGTTGRPKGAMLTHFGTLHSLLHFEYGLRAGRRRGHGARGAGLACDGARRDHPHDAARRRHHGNDAGLQGAQFSRCRGARAHELRPDGAGDV